MRATIILGAVSVPILVCGLALMTVLLDSGFYENERIHLGIPEPTEYHASVARYLTGFSSTIDGVPFTDEERAHMRDVRVIILSIEISAMIALLLCSIVVWYEWKKHGFREAVTVLLYGSGVHLALSLILVIIAGSLFTGLFYGFHELFFKSGTWIFDVNSLIIRMYPMQFFEDALIRIIGAGVWYAALILLGAWAARRYFQQ